MDECLVEVPQSLHCISTESINYNSVKKYAQGVTSNPCIEKRVYGVIGHARTLLGEPAECRWFANNLKSRAGWIERGQIDRENIPVQPRRLGPEGRKLE
jgi:hypothetical protein